MRFKGNSYKTNCRLYMKDGSKPACLVENNANRAHHLEDMAIERFNIG